MDGLPIGNSIHSSRELGAHSHRRGYPLADGTAPLSMSGSMPFMMPSYQMTMPNAKPSCAAAAGASYQQAADCGRMPYAQDSLYKYGASSSAARRSPSRSSVVPPPPMSSTSLSLPHARNSGVHYPSVPGTSSGNPMDLVFPQYHDPPPPPKPSGPPEPPKKPLSPYMRFSKSVWFQVKARNPHLSVCQLGATIGRMWRELTEEEKRKHLEDFHQDKVRYDNELKRYMKTTGLRAKDLKALAKSQPKSKNRHRSRPSSQNHASSSAVAANPQFAAAQFMGLPLVSMPMGVGMPASMLGPSAMGMLPHFSQVWTGQQYPGQPAASAAMMGIAGHLAQGLYSNGYAAADSTAAAGSSLSSAKPPMLTHDGQPLAMYRYSQNYH